MFAMVSDVHIVHIKEGYKGVVFECQHLHCKSQEIETLDFTDFLRVTFSTVI